MAKSSMLIRNIAQKNAEEPKAPSKTQAGPKAGAPAKPAAAKKAEPKPQEKRATRGRPESLPGEKVMRRGYQSTERIDTALKIYAKAHKDEGDLSAITRNAIERYVGKEIMAKAEAMLEIEKG